METLPALRHCFAVVAQREESDSDLRWQWAIRRKVLRWSIAQLERQAEMTGGAAELSSNSLTPAEQRALDSSHPLLRSSATRGLPAFEPNSACRAAIHARVQRFVSSLQTR